MLYIRQFAFNRMHTAYNKEEKILEIHSVTEIGDKVSSKRVRKLKAMASQATTYVQHGQDAVC